VEPFEWLILGTGFAVGMVFGPRRKSVVRSTAKRYLALEERTRSAAANFREGFRDAVAEAHYEHKRDAALRNGNGSRPTRAGAQHTEGGAGQAPGSRTATAEKQVISIG